MVRAMPARRFAYCREPLFALAALLYACNSAWWKPCAPDEAWFVRGYLGDVLCLPVLLPATLWLQRRLGLRAHDEPPSPWEWLGHWALWSVCFELVGPALPLLVPGAVRDPLDVVAYGIGAAAAAVWWGTSGGSLRARPADAKRWAARALVAAGVAGFVLSAYRVRAACW